MLETWGETFLKEELLHNISHFTMKKPQNFKVNKNKSVIKTRYIVESTIRLEYFLTYATSKYYMNQAMLLSFFYCT